ncbi:hypothetical protein [Mesorhizobium sp.]|uniref:hypothetical protein n=1 Tax=Mesorhizobium sp. TaxID=1871066 RepID=UPI000FE4DF65|nr:hypothetical protein [Mesorhizobium sp.]RWB68357.1 MAG: hypothetical protein EOQ49_22625 [Mesorhizobium sp.]
MALLTFAGFDHISTSVDFANYPGWTSSGLLTKTAGLLGGFAITASSSIRDAIFQTGSTFSTLIAGFRFRANTIPASTFDFFKFLDSTSTQCGLSLKADGTVIFWRGTNATVLATSTTVLAAGSWYFFELKVTFHNTTGAYEFRIGGVTEFSGSGANTRNTANNYATGTDMICNGSVYAYDDYYLADTSGGAPANDFLGVIRVEASYPTAADGTSQWTPNASTNVSRVNEAAADDDTTYNSASVSGNIDLFTHGALSSTPTTIFGVAVTAKARKDDVTARSLRTKLKSGTTTQNGASFALATTYQYIRDQYVVDPNTSAAWTATNVNATSIGYEHV